MVWRKLLQQNWQITTRLLPCVHQAPEICHGFGWAGCAPHPACVGTPADTHEYRPHTNWHDASNRCYCCSLMLRQDHHHHHHHCYCSLPACCCFEGTTKEHPDRALTTPKTSDRSEGEPCTQRSSNTWPLELQFLGTLIHCFYEACCN